MSKRYPRRLPSLLACGFCALFPAAVWSAEDSGDEEFVFRAGFSWDFELKNVVLAPAIFYDFTEGQDFLVLGLNIGNGF